MKAILFRYSRRSSTFAYLSGAVTPRAYLAARPITHRFRLDRYRHAFVVGRQKHRHRAVKVVLDFQKGEG